MAIAIGGSRKCLIAQVQARQMRQANKGVGVSLVSFRPPAKTSPLTLKRDAMAPEQACANDGSGQRKHGRSSLGSYKAENHRTDPSCQRMHVYTMASARTAPLTLHISESVIYRRRA